MDTKFKRNETVLYEGEEVKVSAASKDFSTRKISYQLLDKKGKPGIIVPEEELTKKPIKKKIPETKLDSDMEELYKEYKEVLGKGVPANKRNDKAWLLNKIKITKEETAHNETKSIKQTLQALTPQQLKSLIEERELDIDTEDYATTHELIDAIVEEIKANK